MREIRLPKNAKWIIERLRESGFDCYAVGGCVRDCLRGVEPHDWDFTTSANPDETERVFSDLKVITVGKKYGTIAVIIDSKPYEITTYRLDGDYSDSRHPDEVSFSRSLYDDLARRDFTVNAMAYNDNEGIVDLYDGQRDLEYGVIRCVGDAEQRFSEDALRMLRALRFSSVLGFSIENSTSEAILKLRKTLSGIAPERIGSEFLKLICGEKADFIMRRYRSVIAVFIPELMGTFDFDQNNKHHNRDVYRHMVAAMKNIRPDPILRMTMLLHDIGKPLAKTVDKNGVFHYRNHSLIGAAMAEEILRRLCLPKAFTDEVCTLIRTHDERMTPDRALIKGYLRTLGPEMAEKLFEVQRADVLAQSMYMRDEKLSNLNAVRAVALDILDSGECYDLKMLSVNGSDLLHLGFRSGARIGEALNALLDKVILGELPNEKSALLEYARSAFDKT